MSMKNLQFALLLWVSAAPASALADPAAGPQTLFVLTYSEGPKWISGQPMQKQKLGDHAKYMKSLEEQRTLIAAGPFLDHNGGMAVIRAANIEEAQAVLARDPGVLNETFTAKAQPWLPVFGAAQNLPAK